MKTPWWMTALIILLMVPALVTPFTSSGSQFDDTETRVLTWLYPAYVIATGVFAWICYPHRREITWILLILLVLSHIGMRFL